MKLKIIINDNLDMRIIENNKVKFVTFDYYDDIMNLVKQKW